MNDLPRQKLKEIIIQHGRSLCDNPQRCEAFLRDYSGEYKREIFLLISALKQGVAKDLLNSSNIPIELLLGRLTKQMQNDLGLTEEAARYAVESWAQVLDKMPQQQIQQPRVQRTNKVDKPTIASHQNAVKLPLSPNNKQQKLDLRRGILRKAGFAVGLFTLAIVALVVLLYRPKDPPTVIPTLEETPITTPSRYTKLETLLKAQDFREADLETDRVMLAVANRQSEGWLRVEDAENFPCKELRTIDNLWLKYSQGKFGISVQQEIYKNLGGTKKFDSNVRISFGERVGWRKQGSWLNYSELNFSLSAPTGHLPWLRWDEGYGIRKWVLEISSLLSRHVECNP
ncbi:GUN4 domain-containing protein [Cylindrospermopsis raciborskii]|uniref:GUN4 domain-containing protein n=1 Tax=Cylindrospermopsis raciborskii TaxID=77022 RepID=UPI003A8F4A9F